MRLADTVMTMPSSGWVAARDQPVAVLGQRALCFDGNRCDERAGGPACLGGGHRFRRLAAAGKGDNVGLAPFGPESRWAV